MSKIIITAAITGAVHIPTMSPYLPITPDQIVEDAVKACEAGAAIAHIHVRVPENGMPTADPELFYEVHRKVKQRQGGFLIMEGARCNFLAHILSYYFVASTILPHKFSQQEVKGNLRRLMC